MSILNPLLHKSNYRLIVLAEMNLMEGQKKEEKKLIKSVKHLDSFFINFIEFTKEPKWVHIKYFIQAIKKIAFYYSFEYF